MVDLGGATVLPGLLDVHTHPALLASLMDAVPLLPPAVSSIAELVEALRAHPEPADPEDWVEGHGYDDARFPEGRGPDRHDLDRVSTTRPVLARRCDAHTAVVNTAALHHAGITRWSASRTSPRRSPPARWSRSVPPGSALGCRGWGSTRSGRTSRTPVGCSPTTTVPGRCSSRGSRCSWTAPRACRVTDLGGGGQGCLCDQESSVQ
ncbi:amidohydrolase family protein [Propioniciclava sp. MC1595]|uniref:amidohydrolase family protein n=1 Tax=Propioniciclava sp. MC1595 TaxID=2760308 RepID=UPI0016626881|nr:amidohydrolase family protein [Propioniciclava sp. MC1595]QTE24888.1 amidohydrolase family protein [Propioniciclava sp. MC1595]